jgi:predicted dehydrogenase
MSNAPLSIGFIGGALESAIGCTHNIASQMDGRWKLVAGCFSTNQESNARTAEAWGISAQRTYDNWRQMLAGEQGKIDALVVLTPTPSHAEIVIHAADLGYAIICEKTLATSAAEARSINDAIARNKGYLAVTYNYTGYAMLRELQVCIRSGQLGKINQIHVEMPQEGFSRLGKDNAKPTPQDWRLHDNAIPILGLDLGAHVHQLIDFLTAEKPLEVVAMTNSFGFFNGVVDNAMCMAKYSNNLDAQIWFSKSALGHSNGLRVRVYGEIGSAEWYQLTPEFLTLHDNKGKKSIIERSYSDLNVANELRYNRFKAGHSAGFIEAFANHYYDLADDLGEYKKFGRSNCPWVFGGDVAEQGLLLLEAMAESAKSKSWVRLPEKMESLSIRTHAQKVGGVAEI